MKFLERDLVDLNVDADSPEHAIRAAGQLLADADAVSPAYINAMIQSYRKNGPYFVLAPHLAIPHARPEDGVKEAAISMIRLEKPVVFGHSAHDPVRLVFALGASTSDEHLMLLKRLMQLLSRKDHIDMLLKVQSYQDMLPILGGK
jgi:PTS system ascorbate-specific IIA component